MNLQVMYAINPSKLISVYEISEKLIQQATVRCQKCRVHQNLSQEMADSINLTIKYSPDNDFGNYIARSCFSEKCRKIQEEEREKTLEQEKEELEKAGKVFMFCKCKLCVK